LLTISVMNTLTSSFLGNVKTCEVLKTSQVFMGEL